MELQDELEEAQQKDRAASVLWQRLGYGIELFALSIIVIGLGFGFLLLRRLRIPLDELMRGTKALADGELTYRVQVNGHDEFSQIASNFNHMADELKHKQELLEEARYVLQTEVGETAEELRKANDALNRTDQWRRRFFADISHELRTPLTIIQGETQFALRGDVKSPHAYRDALTRVLEQAKHLCRLVDDLLYIARSDGSAPHVRLEKVILTELVYEVCCNAQILADEKGIAIEFENMKEVVTIRGDENRMRQLILILLENALRYTTHASSIRVSVHSRDGQVMLSVTDRGIGIAADELEHVFEHFYRSHRASTIHNRSEERRVGKECRL